MTFIIKHGDVKVACPTVTSAHLMVDALGERYRPSRVLERAMQGDPPQSVDETPIPGAGDWG